MCAGDGGVTRYNPAKPPIACGEALAKIRCGHSDRTQSPLDTCTSESPPNPLSHPDIGRRMAALPLTPHLSRALLAAEDGGCLGNMLSLAGMLSTESSVFLGGRGPQQLLASDAPGPAPSGRPPSRPGAGAPGSAPAPLAPQARAELLRLQAGGLGDHVFLLRLYRAWQAAGAGADWARALGVDARTLRFARDVRAQLERAMAAAEPGARGARSRESGAGVAASGEGRPPRPAKRGADGVPRPQDAPGSRRGSNQDLEGRDGVADGEILDGDEGEHRRLRHALAIGELLYRGQGTRCGLLLTWVERGNFLYAASQNFRSAWSWHAAIGAGVAGNSDVPVPGARSPPGTTHLTTQDPPRPEHRFR